MIDMLTSFTVPVTGAGALYVAWQQYKINLWKMRADHYERRHKIYDAAMQLITTATYRGTVAPDHIVRFRRETADAAFHFQSDITTYIERLCHEAVKLQRADQDCRNSDYDRPRLVAERRQSFDWLSDQFTIAMAKFKPHLNLNM